MKLSYENKMRLETLFFFSIIGLSIFGMLTLIAYGQEWANAMARFIVGIR